MTNRFYTFTVGVVLNSLLLLSSCSKDDLINRNEIDSSIEKDVEVVQNIGANNKTPILKFKDANTYEQTLNKIALMSEKEKTDWLKSFNDFVPLISIYERAMEEATDLGETQEDYINFKTKYEEYLYFPMYKEDFGFYMKVSNENEALLVNANGLVMIGNDLKQMNDIISYEDLQKTGKAYYPIENQPSLKANTNLGGKTLYYNLNAGEYIGEQWSSGWERRDDRQLQVKLGLRIYQIIYGIFTPKMHLEVSFRKKTWLGWANYSSYTSTTGTINITGTTQIPISFQANGSSSHDWYSNEINTKIVNEAFFDRRQVYEVPIIFANLTVTFQGFTSPKYCNFSLPSVLYVNSK